MEYPQFDPGEEYLRLRSRGFKYERSSETIELRESLLTKLETMPLQRDYKTDIGFALHLYSIINPDRVSLATAASHEFWKYVSLLVIPDVVFERWGDNEEHFHKNRRRIWLRELWWFIHLTWQGDSVQTFEVLRHYEIDTLHSIVERPGYYGFRPLLIREIFRQLYALGRSGRSRKLLRPLLKLNTARLALVEPEFCTSGVEGYVSSLLSALTQEA